MTSQVVSFTPAHVELCAIQLCVIKFVSDLRRVDGFIRVFLLPSPKYNRHNITPKTHIYNVQYVVKCAVKDCIIL